MAIASRGRIPIPIENNLQEQCSSQHNQKNKARMENFAQIGLLKYVEHSQTNKFKT